MGLHVDGMIMLGKEEHIVDIISKNIPTLCKTKTEAN